MRIAYCLLAALSFVAKAPDRIVIVEAFDGRNGKALANGRILMFVGDSLQNARQHEAYLEVTTDDKGAGKLTLTPPNSEWIQPSIDGLVLCQSPRGQLAFSVNEIESVGVDVPNLCGSLDRHATPGHLVIFARPAHFLEKMSQ